MRILFARLKRVCPAAIGATVLLLAITSAAYWPAAANGYIWDDDSYVKNQTLRSPKALRQIWFEPRATPQYYPLVHTSFWLEYRVWKLEPAGYHIVNIMLHGIGAVLLWRVLMHLGFGALGSWLAAAIFALHPVHVESVAWITQRKNVLSGVFYFASALTYLHFAARPSGTTWRGRSVILYVGSFALFVCALLSKTVTCSLPAVLLLLQWWRRGRIKWRDLAPLAPFVAVGAALGTVTVWLEKVHVGAVGGDWDLTLLERSLIAGRALWFYVGKLMWPQNLTFVYPRWQIDTASWWQYVYPLSALGVLAVLWWRRRRIGRGPLAAVLIFAGTLLPALGFFNVYPMRYSFVADHFLYLASVSLIVLVAGATSRLVSRAGGIGRALGVTGGISLLVLLGMLTWQQCSMYKNLQTLWQETTRRNPDAWMAQYNLGNELRSEGRWDEAIEHYREATRMRPDLAEPYNNLALVFVKQGKVHEAIDQLRQALAVEPGHAIAHRNLGSALLLQGKQEEGIRQLRRAVRIDPDYANAHRHLAQILQARGRIDEAIVHWRSVARIEPRNAQARLQLTALVNAPDQTAAAVQPLGP